MTVRTATQLLELIENTLGFACEATGSSPRWKVRTAAAGRIKRKIETNPRLYTWENLELAVEYLRRKRQEIRSPMAVFYAVEPALELAYTPVVVPIAELIEQALTVEYARGGPDADDWIGRLYRAGGPGRQSVYDAWVAAGRRP